MRGWVARDKNGGLRLWRIKPNRETNFEYGESWGLSCEMGAWLKLEQDLFPEIKWEDEPVEVTIKLEKED